MLNKITIIGAGNIGSHLAKTLFDSGKEIVQVFSQHIDSAKQVADSINAGYTNNIYDLSQNADIYIISVSDNAYSEIIPKLRVKNKFIVHTSGSLDMSILSEVSERIGVFYPFQTLSKDIPSDFSTIPICIETNNNTDLQALDGLAQSISTHVCYIDSNKRKHLHLSAVFACNFTNLMYSISECIAKENNIPFDLLKPLILETASKISQNTPTKVQTGPAVRKDSVILKKHLDLLKGSPNFHDIYQLLTEEIVNLSER